jgi:hypothetical protein
MAGVSLWKNSSVAFRPIARMHRVKSEGRWDTWSRRTSFDPKERPGIAGAARLGYVAAGAAAFAVATNVTHRVLRHAFTWRELLTSHTFFDIVTDAVVFGFLFVALNRLLSGKTSKTRPHESSGSRNGAK